MTTAIDLDVLVGHDADRWEVDETHHLAAPPGFTLSRLGRPRDVRIVPACVAAWMLRAEFARAIKVTQRRDGSYAGELGVRQGWLAPAEMKRRGIEPRTGRYLADILQAALYMVEVIPGQPKSRGTPGRSPEYRLRARNAVPSIFDGDGRGIGKATEWETTKIAGQADQLLALVQREPGIRVRRAALRLVWTPDMVTALAANMPGIQIESVVGRRGMKLWPRLWPR